MTKHLDQTRPRWASIPIMTLAFMVTSTAAHADIIVVTSTAGTAGGPDCTLRDAIKASNVDGPVGGCPHSGTAAAADTIELGESQQYVLDELDSSLFGNTALPIITGDLTINGNGSVIERDANAVAMRIFFVRNGILRLRNVTVRNGLAQGSSTRGLGGGILNFATIDLVNTQLLDNVAVEGGAIENLELATLSNCTIGNNAATSARGGGICNYSGTLTMRNCTVRDNQAPLQGGGIYHLFGELTLLNTTLSGNTAGDSGGALYANAGGTISDCTVTGNAAPVAGGICGCGAAPPFVETADTIVANQNSGADCTGTIVSGGYNLDTDGSCGFITPGDISGGTPNLGPLQNNGGATETHALMAGSDAIDAGSCAGGSVVADQRGVGRPKGNGCDIGAFEAVCSRFGTCSGHGDCAADDSCDCDAGFAGAACEFSDEVTCLGHGTAQNDGSCVCHEGFEGTSCEACAADYFDFPTCVYCAAEVSCAGQGICDPSTGACICDVGWQGANCDVDVDECTGQPCDPNATCFNEPGGFRCVCNEGYAGDGFVCETANLDRDGDGIPDDADACPDENATGFDADGDGCVDSLDGVAGLIDGASNSQIAGQMKNSLNQKVAAATQQAQRGNTCSAVGVLTALQNQIAAQRGKKISEEMADLLTAYVENLIKQLLAGLPQAVSCG